MSNKRIATYSLLAHINDNTTNLNDINEIFIPLVKSVIGELEQQGIINTDFNLFRSRFDEKYGLKTPIPLLKKLLILVSKNAEKEDQCSFHVNKDGSYMLGSCSFIDFMDILEEQQIGTNSLEQAYKDFIYSETDFETNESIYSFIDNNQKSIIKIITGSNIEITDDREFKLVIKFINKIKMDKTLFNILKKVYLGSIICCYLEYDLTYTGQQKMEFVLDTNFIIKLLDLNTYEDTEICKQILTICGKIGHKLIIMDFTLEETKNLLEAKAEFVDNISPHDIGLDSIFFACTRRRITKTQLQTIAKNIKETLTKMFDSYNCPLKIININDHMKDLVKKDDSYTKLMKRDKNIDGVLHDATAVYYIKSERHKRNISGKGNFKELMYWFITDDKSLLTLISKKGYKSESIEPNKLLNILWLGSPSCDSGHIKDIGLTKLISNTINNCISKSKVFKELEENFIKYEDVSEDDIMWLSYGVANNAVNLMDIEEINTYESNDFVDKFHEKIADIKNTKEEVLKKEAELERTKAEHSDLIKRNQELYEEELRSQRLENKRIHLKYEIEKILNNNERELKNQRALFMDKNRDKEKLKKTAKNQVKWLAIISCLCIAVVLYLVSKFILENWTNMDLEPIITIIGSLILPSLAFVITFFLGKRLDIVKLKEDLSNKRATKLLKRNNLNEEVFQDIDRSIRCLELDIALCNTIFEDLDKNRNIIDISLNYNFNINENSYKLKDLVNKIEISA